MPDWISGSENLVTVLKLDSSFTDQERLSLVYDELRGVFSIPETQDSGVTISMREYQKTSNYPQTNQTTYLDKLYILS